ncbi:hypothetical protein H8K33_10160 [Undibacterium amnicola]|uniref:Uncharacterized protein n=1 Tax=Undibacterium amnicola TaxID=1834038 RepID=A0ABR6XR35_9BURK|nr:hypothetical protein [Undibacterium amnicola]
MNFKKKTISFLIIWGIFLCLYGIIILFNLFILSPLIILFREGYLVFFQNIEFTLDVVSSGVLGSFLAAFVTWFWAEFFPRMKIK